MTSPKRLRTTNYKNTQQQQKTQDAILPPELWVMIAELLPVEDLIELRQTSRLFGSYARRAYNSCLTMAATKIAKAKKTVYQCIREGDKFALLALARDPRMDLLTLDEIYRIYMYIYQNQRDRAPSLIMAFCGGMMKSGSKTMMHVAAVHGHVAVISELISRFGVSVDIEDSDGCTPLFYATEYGLDDVVDLLVIRFKANVNARCRKKTRVTPLHMAVSKSVTSIAKKLLTNGADPNAVGNRRYTPLHLAVKKGKDILVQMLIGYDADIQAQTTQGLSALHMAVDAQNESIAQLLIIKGARIDTYSKKGESPLHTAIRRQDVATIDILIHKKADVNIANKKGDTPLHLAMNTASSHIWYLVTWPFNADFTCKNERAKTPLDYANRMIKKCHRRARAKVLALILEGALFGQRK